MQLGETKKGSMPLHDEGIWVSKFKDSNKAIFKWQNATRTLFSTSKHRQKRLNEDGERMKKFKHVSFFCYIMLENHQKHHKRAAKI